MLVAVGLVLLAISIILLNLSVMKLIKEKNMLSARVDRLEMIVEHFL